MQSLNGALGRFISAPELAGTVDMSAAGTVANGSQLEIGPQFTRKGFMMAGTHVGELNFLLTSKHDNGGIATSTAPTQKWFDQVDAGVEKMKREMAALPDVLRLKEDTLPPLASLGLRQMKNRRSSMPDWLPIARNGRNASPESQLPFPSGLFRLTPLGPRRELKKCSRSDA